MSEEKKPAEVKLEEVKLNQSMWLGNKHYHISGSVREIVDQKDKSTKTLLTLDRVDCEGKNLTYNVMYKIYEMHFEKLAEEVKKQTGKTIFNPFEKVVDTAGKI